jgi:DNA-binding response OmpR family regulator
VAPNGAAQGATPTRKRVLVVEDEVAIAEAVAARLSAEGYEVALAHDGPSGVARCDEWRPHLVVLDLMLPGMDGFEVCRTIQRDRHVPVLMLTALDQETDLVVGLRLGADDYMTKPFSPRELVARVGAILRRVEARDPREADSGALRSGRIELRPGPRLALLDGEAVHLTPTEFDLLHHLFEAGGSVCTRDQLLAAVWGYRDTSGARTVDSHVRSLRRKLGDDVIRTVHAVGYAAGRTDQDPRSEEATP